MRKVFIFVLVSLLAAACSGTSSPTASTVASAPAPSLAPAPPASAATSPAASAAPSGLGDFKAYADATLRPALNEVSAAFNAWGTAFNAAAKTDASDADKAAYADAASKLKTALANAKTALDGAPTVPCASDARAQAAAFLALVQNGLDPLLSKTSIGLGDLAVAGALLQEAAKQAPLVATAIKSACQ